MKIKINELLEDQKDNIDIKIDVDSMDKRDLSEDISIISPISFTGKAANQSGKIFVIGEYKFVAEFVCNRCLDKFQREINGTLNEQLIKEGTIGSDSEEFYEIKNYMIDMKEILDNTLILALPIKVICDDDNCKGLCPACGANLNKTQCHCEEKKVDSRLEILKEWNLND